MAVLAVPYDSVLQLRLVIGNDPESGKRLSVIRALTV